MIGRDGERDTLLAVLSGAAAGRPQGIVLRGDPGIGKTALLEAVLERAEGFEVLRIQGHEAERELPFAGLSALVGALRGDGDNLQAGQASALDGALNRGPALHGDRMAVVAAVLGVLAHAAERAPLIVAVDDIHLVDAATIDALFGAFARLQVERIAMIVTARPDEDVPGELVERLDDWDQLWLPGLDLAASRALVAARGPLPEPVWRDAGGNPLALLELASPAEAGMLDAPMPLPARLLRAYGRRLSGLPEPTARALLVLAVAARATHALDAALHQVGVLLDDIDPAETAGLVEVRDGSLGFTHPLVRSAVYHSASPAARRSAHAAMATALAQNTGPGLAERRAHHLAESTAGPDEGVAGQIAAAARAAADRHSHTVAAPLFEKAAWLSPPGPARVRRILDAALAGQAAGIFESAGRLLEEVLREAEDEDTRAAATHLRCRIRMWSGHPTLARDELLALAARTEDRVPFWAALMYAQAAVVSIALGEQHQAIAMADSALALTDGTPDEVALPILVSYAVTQAINGGVVAARGALDRADPHLDGCDPLSIDQLPVLAALGHACLGDVPRARALLESTVRRTRGVQAAGLLPFQLSWLTLVLWMDGDWLAGLANGHAAVQLARETGWTTELPNCLMALATIETTLGRQEEAEAHAAEAVRLSRSHANGLMAAHAARLAGLSALGRARPDEAARHLAAAGEFARRGRMGDSVLFGWAGDLTEALVRADRRGAAEETYRAVVDEADRTLRAAQLAVAARCRALLAESPEAARTGFEEALGWHAEAGVPFETARTRLCFGEFLRRVRRRAEAREQLELARATFDALGAKPWIERADAELAASGRRARPRGAAMPTEELTAQELQVAVVVAEGVSNAEAAARMFLSPKTIEFHLSSVYRKLGIGSRAELAATMRASEDHGSGGSGAPKNAAS